MQTVLSKGPHRPRVNGCAASSLAGGEDSSPLTPSAVIRLGQVRLVPVTRYSS